MIPYRRFIRCALLLMGSSAPVALTAQGASRWTGSAEASGNLLYGAASQRVLSGALGAQRLDERAELRFDLQSSYGDSRRADSDIRDVTVRNTTFRSSVDIRPKARLTPFGFATATSSLQQRIASRVNGGAGAKYTIWQPDSVRLGFPEDASISVAVLAEQTRALADPSVSPDAARAAAGTRTRWSVRARYRRLLAPYLRLSHVSFYQPTTGDLGEYTLEATTVLGVPLRDRLDFTITHRERIDSEATERGAPSTRDGQLLFGVRAAFR